MFTLFIELLRHTVTLVFGVFISASFLNIAFHKKNIIILSMFSVLDLALQGLFFFTESVSFIQMLYPLFTHLPLFLLFVLVFKKEKFSSSIAVTSTYLCCQISNWLSIIPISLKLPDWTVNIIYTLTLLGLFVLIIHFVSVPYSRLLTKPARSLIFFGIVPSFYYVFDYITTVYTESLYSGNLIAIEFTPFLLCVCYLTFCVIYFKQYEEKQEIEKRNQMIELQYEQSKKDIKRIRQSEKAVSLLRHDMRHFLNNIALYIEKNDSEKALDYIHRIIENVENTTQKKYCANETINMILSSYEDTIMENGITFRYSLSVSKTLPISDVDMTSILSNSLENAIHAVLSLDTQNRIIELRMTEKSNKLLLSLENTYGKPPTFVDGMPITNEKEHGFGTQSIRYTVEKQNGNCHFSINKERFILQIIL